MFLCLKAPEIREANDSRFASTGVFSTWILEYDVATAAQCEEAKKEDAQVSSIKYSVENGNWLEKEL